MISYRVGTAIGMLVALLAYLPAARADQPKASESAGKQEPAAAQPAPAPAKTESKITTPEVTIKVLSRGSDPKKALRYKFTQGKKSTMVIEMKMAMNIEMGGIKQPEMDHADRSHHYDG